MQTKFAKIQRKASEITRLFSPLFTVNNNMKFQQFSINSMNFKLSEWNQISKRKEKKKTFMIQL